MKKTTILARLSQVIIGFALSVVVMLAGPAVAAAQFGGSPLCEKTDPHDNAELQKLTEADQAARSGDSSAGRDAGRLARVLALYHADSIRTAADFSNAWLILQHGRRPEHYLMAQEMAVTAMGLGCGDGEMAAIGLSEPRWLWSLGLNAYVLHGEPTEGNIEIADPPPAFWSLPLTMALVTQAHALQAQLQILHQQHPEYPWPAFTVDTSLDILAAAVARSPAVTAAFAQGHLTPHQWQTITTALQGAIDNAFFAPLAPRPMASVTGALAWPVTAKHNIEFVLSHQAELTHDGYDVDVMDADTSELARPHLVPAALPPDTRALAWADPCPAAAPDTVPDNPVLVRLVDSVVRAGRAATSPALATARSARVLVLRRQQAIRTPRDQMRAAIVLEHGVQPEDALRALDLAIAAVPACGRPAMQLMAATEDRFLARLGLKQRFGTLPPAGVPVDAGPAGVVNGHRQLLGLPPLP